jgi:hypothetical protein
MGHGTRYNEGDVVEVVTTEPADGGPEFIRDYGVVDNVRDPRSDSPLYKVVAIFNGEKYEGEFRASGLDKVQDWELETEILLENRMEVEVKQTRNSFYEDLGATAFEAEGTGVNGESEWIVFRGSTQATRAAEATVERDLEENPNLFNDDFLKKFVYIGSTDKRMMAQDEAYFETEGRNRKELEDIADRNDIEYSEEDSEAEISEKIQVQRSEEIQEKLEEDPLGYFEDRGIYSDFNEMMEELPLRIDIEEAEQAAVKADGTAHYLDRYDGEPVRLENGALAYGIN